MPADACPHCNKEIAENLEQCPHCQGAIGDGINPYQSPVEVESTKRQRTWMLTISGACFVGSLLVALVAPGITVALVLLIIPTTVRALSIQRRVIERDGFISFDSEFAEFFGSALVIFGCSVAGVIAFFAVCFPIGIATFQTSHGIDWAVGLGLLASLVVGVSIARYFWTPRSLL